MASQSVYLDYNATAPVRSGVVEAVSSLMQRVGNPSSVHTLGRNAKRDMETARAKLAGLLNAPVNALVFTSGGTEANNLALTGLTGQHHIKRLLVSSIEHDSVLECADRLEAEGVEQTRIPVTSDGVLDLEAFREMLFANEAPALVSVMMANNEIGSVQPIRQVVEIARQHGSFVHTDAVQACGKVSVDFRDLDVDLMTVSGHKLGGLQGTGALAVRLNLKINPIISGGGQEGQLRSGTENLPGIVALGCAAEACFADLGKIDQIRSLRDRLEKAILSVAPDALIYGQTVDRLANTTCVGMPGRPAETQVMAMDLAGVCVSAGSACSSGKVKTSAVLKALGLDDKQAGEAIRFSLGWNTTEEDIDQAIKAWSDHYKRTTKRSAA